MKNENIIEFINRFTLHQSEYFLDFTKLFYESKFIVFILLFDYSVLRIKIFVKKLSGL